VSICAVYINSKKKESRGNENKQKVKTNSVLGKNWPAPLHYGARDVTELIWKLETL
jgi:hypothetical protein